MEAEKTAEIKSENQLIQTEKCVEINSKRYEYYVCGMDQWCGTDGCPMDPQ
jgi:hypothetical protein